jgi:hypothetical protein
VPDAKPEISEQVNDFGDLTLGGAFVDDKIAADVRRFRGWKIESCQPTTSRR